jgi:RimJ/RimL family protein N-acetyltransferase
MLETIINWQPGNLENSVVKLLPLTENDFEILFQVASDPLIWEQHPTKDRYQREVFQLYFDGAVSSKTSFLINNKASDETIGSTRYYDYRPEISSIAIGYTFMARQYWGGHYNKAVKKLLIDYAFHFVDNVYFHIGANNIRSQLATSKIGARKVNEVDFDHYGRNVLHYEYLLRQQDWTK